MDIDVLGVEASSVSLLSGRGGTGVAASVG
jgi:hypothetical protein